MKQVLMFLLALAVSVPVSAVITHRYDFEADANDLVGGLKTVLENGAVVQNGALVLGGGSPGARAVLDGPGIAINTYTSVSIEAWFMDNGLSGWTRVFDFGDTSGGDGGYCLFYTPSGPGRSRLAISTNGFPSWSTGEQLVDGPVLTSATKYHIVCVYEAGGGSGGLSAMRIYHNGVLAASNTAVSMPLSGLHNNFAYLGSAVYPGDPELNGSIYEFRIYDKALNPGEVRFTNHFGENNAYPLVIRSHNPIYGQTLVPVTPTLSWTPEANVDVLSYNLYLGTDPNIMDPNRSDVSGISTLVVTNLASPSYTVPSAQKLLNNKVYYWRVDTVATDLTTYQGAGMTFTSIPAFPAFTVNPVSAYVFEGQTAELTATCQSLTPLTDAVRWYKVGTPDVEVTAGGDVSIQTVTVGDLTTTTLSIANVDAAREASYYVKATNAGGSAVSSSAKIVLKKLIAYWPFENNLTDASGTGYHGTAVGNLTYAAGKVGQALDLSGATDTYVDLPDGFADFVGGLTFNVWAYPRSAANWARFLEFGNGANADNIYFARNGTSATLQYTIYKGSTSSGTVSRTNTIALNAWQMFTITMDASGSCRLYKDGLQIATGTVQIPNVVTRINNYIGKSNWAADAYYNGLLDEIRIYNYALTPDEVADRYVADTGAPYCRTRPTYDLNNDCLFNLADFAIFAAQWLDCGLYPASDCPN
ncbi:MAG TPA: hypothetical protein PK052_09770 [Anaerohalosphaeraceae bacterium]|mgnify:CR=1 FL=1|nr:hypothetical protein [Anaerohalosphaeraceae bacterium]HOL32255.1 hypothetical protein [Anaerohalosphaeraceae bacterium]HOM76823.1 hypothetical protein [Anaerohalosphaeraceae bacterium]HPC65600.1 hypothetical protein [Anaerohalosphaeraceae bacterium]HRS70414.1 hypothetical protein [Anaerohalosphaeraceae bacterium]